MQRYASNVHGTGTKTNAPTIIVLWKTGPHAGEQSELGGRDCIRCTAVSAFCVVILIIHCTSSERKGDNGCTKPVVL